MSHLVVKKKSEMYIQIRSVTDVHREVADYFSVEWPEAKYLERQPRDKYWDDMIHVYTAGTGELDDGLLSHHDEW